MLEYRVYCLDLTGDERRSSGSFGIHGRGGTSAGKRSKWSSARAASRAGADSSHFSIGDSRAKQSTLVSAFAPLQRKLIHVNEQW